MIDIILNYLVFVVVAINTLLSIGIFLRNPQSRANRFYVISVTLLNLWILSNFFENEPDIVGLDNVGLFLRLDFIFAYLMISVWYQFCLAFVGVKSKILSGLGFFGLLSGFIFSILSLLGDLLIKNISFKNDVIYFENGELWPVYGISLVALLIGGLVTLLMGRYKANEKAKSQVDLVFWGFFLSPALAFVINYIQVFYPISLEVSRIGLYGMVFLVVFTGYAIARQQLFEMKIVIIRSIGFLIFITLFCIIYASLFGFILTDILMITADFSLYLWFVGMSVVAMLTFQPLFKLITAATDRVFLKGQYNQDLLLSEINRILAVTIELDELTVSVLHVFMREINISKAAFILVKDHKVSDIKGIGYENKPDFYRDLEKLFHQEKLKGQDQTTFIYEDLAEGELRDIFKKLDILIAQAINVQNQEVALLVLGSKLTGERYNQTDINVFNIFASESGIAIQNAKNFSALKELNEVLEQRVIERTKQLAESQRKEIEKARELSKLKDEFVFVAAHELRTPLIFIRGFLEVLNSNTAKLPKNIRDDVKSMSEASETLNKSIGDLLNVARSESDYVSMSIITESVNTKDLIDEVIKDQEAEIKNKNISITIDGFQRADKVIADRKRLKEVFANVIDNAVKYNRKDGQIKIMAEDFGNRVGFEFSDTGFGVPEKQKNKIFQKFFRADTPEIQSISGSGLGLFLSKMIIEKMEGIISFDTVEGKGSKVSIILPKDLVNKPSP